ncbi:MAG: hypothetical protein Q8M26_06475 [Pseudolabrys sp.]|nr:hypothetical protein [Pseudolabrys sp.]
MNDQQFDDIIRAALKRNAGAAQTDDAAVARVLTRLARPLPPQKRAWWRLPAELLDWQFAPAWPRMAALAGCAVLGFTIGLAGLDRTFDRADAAPPSLSLFDDSDGFGAGL